MIPEAELDSAAGAEYHFPDVVSRERGDLRDRLGERCRAGDDVTFRTRATFEKGPPAVRAVFEVEEEFGRQGLGLPLNVDLDSTCLKEGMPVVMEVVEF